MDLKNFYFQNVQENEYHYRFHEAIENVNKMFNAFRGYEEVNDFEFIVYDRYGGRVFVSSSPDNRWDGTHSGKQVAEGGYLYYLKAKLQNGQTIERKGSVNVVYP